LIQLKKHAMFTFSKTKQQNLKARAYARARARALARAASRAATRAATRAKVANKIAKKVIKRANKIALAVASITSQGPKKDKATDTLKKAVRAAKSAKAVAVRESEIAQQKNLKARSLAKKARGITRVAEPVQPPALKVASSSGIPVQGVAQEADQLPASDVAQEAEQVSASSGFEKFAERLKANAKSLWTKVCEIARVAEPVQLPASDVDSSSGIPVQGVVQGAEQMPASDVDSSSGIPEQGAEQLPASSSEKSEHAFAQGATREYRMFLRTLACFFPKFSYDDDDNANDSAKSSAQDTMREALKSGKYQVRISPKHSGSLGLWNIEKRFFQAKNSASNKFTKTSQIVLANIIASFCKGDTLEEKLAAAKQKIELIEKECRGLCIGMEVVTRGGITGEHGDTPHVNYAVVTSICRTYTNGPDRFFGASEVIEFCCKYGLLWNEAFIITSVDAFDKFCKMHDENLVNGTDSTVIPLLRQLANTHIPAISHSELQGEILEGVVVRLEPREDKTCADLATETLKGFSLESLRAFSNELDAIWSKCGRDDKSFVKCIQQKLDAFWGSDEITLLSKEEAETILASIVSMKPLDESHVVGSSETTGIQGLVALMRSDKAYKKNVCFKGLRLRDGSVCFIVHVLLDKVFATFKESAPKGTIPLYRGYSFIVENSATVQSIRISHMHDAPATPVSLDSSSPPPLSCMFKAKYMPYMIRTFIMRNCGGRLFEELMKGDPSAISKYNESIVRYLKSWVTSTQMKSEAFAKYEIYLIGWGKFILEQVRTGGLVEFKRYLELIQVYKSMRGPSVSGSDSFVPPPNGSLVVVTYPCDVPAQCNTAFHQQMVEKYGASAHILFASEKGKTFEDLGRFRQLVKNGTTIVLVVSLTANGLCKEIEAMVNSMSQVAWWVYSGIPDVQKPFENMDKGVAKGAENKSKKWVSFLSNSIRPENMIVPPHLAGPNVSIPKDFDLASFFPDAPIDLRCLLEEMQKRPVYSPDCESKVCVITFPAIPGSGKSTLASEKIRRRIAELTGYEVFFLDGDDPVFKKAKYWPTLWDHINLLPLYGGKYLFIASKNAPVGGKGDLYKDIREKCPAGVKFAVALAEEGGITPDGFPFSLEYLALCMSRVVRRTKQDHNGLFGRDAWQISTMFYNIYAGLSRRDMLKRIAVLTESVIDLPVVSKEAPQMPEELQALLHSCIRGDSLDGSGKSTNSVPTELVLKAFEEHTEYLASIKVPLADYEEAFVQQVKRLLEELESSSVVKPDAPDFEYVGAFVKDETAYAKVLSYLKIERKNSEKPHVTLLHSKNKGAQEFFQTMLEHIGKEVSVSVDAIVMSSTSNQIAFQVNSMTFLDGTEVPVVNSWPHMTISCESGCAWLSNGLPQQVEYGTATKMFIEPITFTCVVDWVKK